MLQFLFARGRVEILRDYYFCVRFSPFYYRHRHLAAALLLPRLFLPAAFPSRLFMGREGGAAASWKTFQCLPSRLYFRRFYCADLNIFCTSHQMPLRRLCLF